MAFSLTKKFLLLCEGPADQIFFQKLFDSRKIDDFDIPEHEKIGSLYGWQALGKMLLAVSGDPGGYGNLKGILIVADSCDDPVKSFKRVCSKIKTHGPYGSHFLQPNSPLSVTKQIIGHPPISIMLVPTAGTGALETLCVAAIFNKRAWLRSCVETYLGCGQIKALQWPAEKRDKAKLQCAIAALNQKDPNKALKHMLKQKSAIIPFRSKVFTPLIKQVRKFLDDARNLP